MLLRAFLLGGFLILGAHCDIYSDLFNNHDPFSHAWTWANPHYHSKNSLGSKSTKDREPLSPDYKDPVTSSSDQKPVLQPKPNNPSTTTKSPVNPVIPGGVIDVDANGGFPTLTSSFGPEFDFSSSFGLNSKPFGIGDLFGGFARSQWWKGDNVCIEREESTDDDDDDDQEEEADDKKNETEQVGRQIPDLFSTSIRLSNCFETSNKYECVTKINNHGIVKTFTVRYKCCYGYKRTSGKGCEKQGDLKPIMDTLTDMKADEFKNLIKSTGLESKFTEGNFSLIVPTDDALNLYNEKLNDMNNVDLSRRRRAIKNALSNKDLVLSHTIEGFIDLQDIGNEEILRSENNNSSIRFNMYPTQSDERLVTANCARIKTPNVLSKSGIVHMAEGVVIPATEDIESVIRQHPRLTSFRKALEYTDISTHIKPDGHYTVFAPTDEAFNKLEEGQKQKILNGGGCVDSILKFHFTPHTVCSSAIIGNATTHNVEGDILNLERTADDELIFEGKAKISEADIMGTNGVIHLLDDIIIPPSGLYIGSVLRNHNFSKFQDIIEKAGMREEINSLNNATVFVPVDKAFETPEAKKLLEATQDSPDKLKEIVRYHIVQGQLQSGDMNNNLLLTTNDYGKELRVNLYSTLPLFTNVVNRATVNCARLIGFDDKACGSVIHEVNKVLVPPSQNILEIIETTEKYSTLRSILKDTEVEAILQQSNQSLTFLAPTDETFAAMDEKDRKVLLEDKEKANVVLRNHVLTEVLCCAGVGPQSWGFSSFVSTLGSSHVEIGRSGSQIRINKGVVTSCDTLATNGVIHTINKVLLPRRQPVSPTIGGGFFLFDI
ncbi:transforming growth factor-beta-induced protein ig-h3 [Anoplophora glabripennis]|nr:transforming growth factor-beta-induced protein ig-h3 [Anoplophora glabripennis]